MSAPVYPYLRPPATCITFTPWQSFGADGVPVSLPATVAAWDYQTDLHLTRDVKVDAPALLQHAGLPPETELACVCEWTATASQLSGLLGHVDDLIAASTHTLTGRIAGTNLGGSLVLRTAVVVAVDSSDPQSFIASRAGEILLDDVMTTRLQGDDAMFPISVCDFTGAGIDPAARWYLQTPPDPDMPVMGGLRLYLNAADKELVNAAVRAAAPTPAQQRLLDEMRHDVTRQLVDLVLLRPDWLEALPHCVVEPDSFGASLAIALESLFPGEPHQTLAAQRAERPGEFAARLQGALRRATPDGAS
ncbi:hypothetical protein [Cryptosporangium minutisporangium]|uniref:FAD-binding PCMH-type domain-containing protein n=1 Tax=Cryptosporangium minutisporangium TaxID=113569 RepID=A0ABP6SXF7_9ACTN